MARVGSLMPSELDALEEVRSEPPLEEGLPFAESFGTLRDHFILDLAGNSRTEECNR